MHKGVVFVVAPLLALTAACGSVSHHATPDWSPTASPVPISVSDWYHNHNIVSKYSTILGQLDSAVHAHSVSRVKDALARLEQTKTSDMQEYMTRPTTNTNVNNRLSALAADVDGLVDSFQDNVVSSNFTGLSRALVTEASFKDSLSELNSYVKKLLGVK